MPKLIPAQKYCRSVFDGTHDTPKSVEVGYPLVTSKNISGGRLNLTNAYNISQEDFISIKRRSSVSQWDILFSMIGSVGEVYLESNNDIRYAIKNIGVFSCGSEERAKWLYYYFQSPPAKLHIKRYLNGAVQKFLPLGALRKFPVLPYDKKSSKIVDVLSLLDSKIEISKRINAELEAMAKTIYDYWFVQFDFPDKNDKPHKSSGGKMVYNVELKREIPRGWIVDKLGNKLKSILGGTPSTVVKEYWQNGEFHWLNSGEISNFPVITSEWKISKNAIENSATSLMPKGTVALSITRHIRATILGINSCANQSVIGILTDDKYQSSFVYPFIKNEIPRYLKLRSGAQQPHINKQTVDNTLMLFPDNDVLDKYYKIVNPLYDKIINNAFQNHNLISLRDWLLPMLMNGQVTVKDAQNIVNEETQINKAAEPKAEYSIK